MCFSKPKSTVCVNKALSWASIKPLSTQCLSLSETLCDGNLLLLLQFNVFAISWWKERQKERSEWASIVLCSREFTHKHTHLPNHIHSMLLSNEINALSFPLCAKHLIVPRASCDQTPHHVLQFLILILTQCCFCILLLLFIHIVFSHNKGFYFWWCFYNIFFFWWKFLPYHFLMVDMLFSYWYLVFLIPSFCCQIPGTSGTCIALALSFHYTIYTLLSNVLCNSNQQCKTWHN